MLARHALFSGLALLFYISGAIAEEKPCTVHGDGKFYDLNSLKSKKDYEIQTPSGQKISLNVCQSVRTELFGLKDGIEAGDVGAFVRRAHGDFAFGKVNTTLTVFDGRPRFVLSGGSRCKPRADGDPVDVRASALVEFVCDMSTFGPGTPRLLAQLPPGDDEAGCAYVIEWKTHYACPTSEGGGVWGFFAILAVVFLVLLMTYTVLGTLYNRYVLQLRGFDQIPQFSLESMQYHGREAYDWIKDMVATLDIGGRASGAGSGYSGFPSAGIPTTNPISHQSRVFGASDIQEDGGAFGGGGAGFIRPQTSRTQSTSSKRFETNPVSHQTQVNAQNAHSLSFSTTIPHSPPPPTQSSHPESTIPQIHRPSPSDSRGSTKDERDFMLGDEDDDAQELGDFSIPPPVPQKIPSSPLPQQVEAPSISATTSTSEENPAAAARGRDLGGGDVIRL